MTFSIIWNSYYAATKLLQTDICIIVTSNQIPWRRLNDMFSSHGTIFSSGSVTLVSIVMSGKKKLPGKPKLPKVST